MAALLSQQNLMLHTFPRTMFKVTNFTTGGYSCMPDKIPIDRHISYPLASNYYKVSSTSFSLLIQTCSTMTACLNTCHAYIQCMPCAALPHEHNWHAPSTCPAPYPTCTAAGIDTFILDMSHSFAGYEHLCIPVLQLQMDLFCQP